MRIFCTISKPILWDCWSFQSKNSQSSKTERLFQTRLSSLLVLQNLLSWRTSCPRRPPLPVPQNVREFIKVAVEELADAFMLLQTEVVVVALRGRQVDEIVQRERKALSVQEVRGRKRREVKVSDVSQAGERVAPQEGFCGRKWKHHKLLSEV